MTKVELIKQKDQAYWERNQLVAALSKIYPAWLGYHKEPDWEDDWRTIVYIKIPVLKKGPSIAVSNPDYIQEMQISWHIHDSDRKYFEHLDPGPEEWDGHTSEDKYERLRCITGKPK
jgi:hypothetical protein